MKLQDQVNNLLNGEGQAGVIGDMQELKRRTHQVIPATEESVSYDDRPMKFVPLRNQA